MSLDRKYDEFQHLLSNLDTAAVAFSGGVESTLLFKKAETANSVVALEGSNIDYQSDYRPGQKAVSELGIRTPPA